MVCNVVSTRPLAAPPLGTINVVHGPHTIEMPLAGFAVAETCHCCGADWPTRRPGQWRVWT